ncbi:hypothetical protein JAAARDRAFT_31968 [Jaapia argillacea MUCL 33604]|uniref:PQ-loop-domain-containing protein n=1 Tax=Jaapia argillacea MUCL 33604 TaxID=933084 RepID=A0A067QBW1_9AGAM|nr:hypothetical protein JAAARDRAFT_31968 [Jaapia argillacea MUCL 33604]
MHISDWLGYTSIGCWLFAQFPQLLENARRRSVDGLALPFLLNWMLGDLSNLIGCLLTRQLPFQTYLATYFCFVDLTLVSQYLYYRSVSKPTPSAFPHVRTRTISSSTARRLSIERPGAPNYRAIAATAQHAAEAAAVLAAHQEDFSGVHRNGSRHWTGHGSGFDDDPVQFPTREATEMEVEGEDDVDEEALAKLCDSFHSEGGGSTLGHGGKRKHVSWSQERYASGQSRRGRSLGRGSRQATLSPITPITTLRSVPGPQQSVTSETHDAEGLLIRGRPLQREVGDDEEGGIEGGAEEWRAGNTTRRNSRASRMGASIVFLGAWALFGVGNLAAYKRGVFIPTTVTSTQVGHVVTSTSPEVSSTMDYPVDSTASVYPEDFLPPSEGSSEGFELELVELDLDEVTPSRDDGHTSPKPPPRDAEPSPERVIGRIFAWICTTLYLTSRLPQIWKNFARKSVEGLSMFLFVFAFLGNLFYVSSILSSPNMKLPPAEASAFIRESIPYLLGSGGTLMFDITIVMQSFLYRPRPHGHQKGKSKTMSGSAEEEAGLLATDSVFHHDQAHARARTTTRSRSTSFRTPAVI